MSLNSLVPKWSKLDSAVTLEEFFANIEDSAKIGRWEESDKSENAVLNLTGSRKYFIRVAPNSTKRERRGKRSKTPSHVGIKTCIPTNTISPSCKPQGRLDM
jgi:hypothetical protein